MPTNRVGTVSSSGLALYANPSDGSLFYKEDRVRVPLHGNTKWTTIDGVHMKGTSPVLVNVSVEDQEERDVRAAIAASLAENDHMGAVEETTVVEEASTPAQAPSERTCCICLTNVPDHLLRPCRHLALCGTCAPRFRRSSLPCPVCRARVSAIDQIYHA
jgi:hypothetical protein